MVDRGFYSADNLKLLSLNGNSYIIPIPSHLKVFKETMAQLEYTQYFYYVFYHKSLLLSLTTILTQRKEQELIRSLRLQGWGYKRIAKELKLNRNQVQLFCKTHGLGGAGKLVKLNMPIWYEQNGRCIICGEKLDQKGRGRTKRFCSGKCRTKYYRMRKEEAEEEPWL